MAEITLRLDDMQATDVFTALGDLLAEEIWDLTGEPVDDWTDHRLEVLGRHAHAVGFYATALGLALLPGEAARQQAATAARAAALAQLEERLARLETRPGQGMVSAATRARIEAIRAEFADDPAALALLVDLAGEHAVPVEPAAAPAPARQGAPA
jgi:hypothetical protein